MRDNMNGEWNGECPIWETPASVGGEKIFTHDVKRVDSPRAGGQYEISMEAESCLPRLDDRAKARLTSWLVDQRRLGNEWPEVQMETLEIEGQQRRDLSVQERADRLLYFLEDQTESIDKIHTFRRHDINGTKIEAWSESIGFGEVDYLLKYLQKQGWIENPSGSHPDFEYFYTITVDGYSRLEELRGVDTKSSTGFVAMWFDNSTQKAWEKGIKPGIEDAGYTAVRIDQVEHNNKIDDEIIAEIRRSRFVVADFTHGESGARGGVYFEAGFAQGNCKAHICCHRRWAY